MSVKHSIVYPGGGDPVGVILIFVIQNGVLNVPGISDHVLGYYQFGFTIHDLVSSAE